MVYINNQTFKMRKYGNISQYLVTNTSLLSQNLSTQRNYDVIPTYRRGQNQRSTTDDMRQYSPANGQNLQRADTTATIPNTNTKRVWNQNREQNSPYLNQGQSEGSRSRKSQRILNQRFRKQDRVDQSPQRQKVTLNLPQWQRQIKNSIFTLKEIKENLESEIRQMQNMLDNTSKSIENMQTEFEKLKFKILDYTSKCLDNAFINYRRKMPRWSKYEEVEKKGLQLVAEISQYIDKQTDNMAKVSAQLYQVNYTNSLKQISNRITHYNSMTQEIKKVKLQCIQKHPTIQQDKINQFQVSLHELCAF